MAYTPELTLLKAFLSKELYSKYIHLIDSKHIKNTYKELGYIYEALTSLHEQVPGDVSLSDLKSFFYTLYPECDASLYNGMFDLVAADETSDHTLLAVIKEIQTRKAALKLSEQAFLVHQGKAPLDSLNGMMDGFVSNVEPMKKVTLDIEQLLTKRYSSKGIPWRLSCLNRSLGGLRDGDFGFLFARPETGKTTFLASEVSYKLEYAKALGRPIDWFNNEEDGDKVMLRIYQSYFGVGVDKLASNFPAYRKAFQAEFEGVLNMYDEGNMHRKDIERIIEKDNPCIVLYDQLPKIKGFNADRKDLELGAIFQWARELAKGKHAGIAVSQADGTAEGVRYLTMDHVANAKTAVQAEADWILGIGKTHDQAFQMVRYLNISKNKLTGDEETIEELRHGSFETIIRPDIARYDDVVTYS